GDEDRRERDDGDGGDEEQARSDLRETQTEDEERDRHEGRGEVRDARPSRRGFRRRREEPHAVRGRPDRDAGHHEGEAAAADHAAPRGRGEAERNCRQRDREQCEWQDFGHWYGYPWAMLLQNSAPDGETVAERDFPRAS